MRKCPNCKAEITGRTDKKFCNPYCKSNYHYEQTRQNENSRFKMIDKQLKLNRKILKNFNKAGKATVRKEKLLKEGFNPKFFTHYWKNPAKDVYLFCYEFGFLYRKDERGIERYVLVQYQKYMN